MAVALGSDGGGHNIRGAQFSLQKHQRVMARGMRDILSPLAPIRGCCDQTFPAPVSCGEGVSLIL